VGPPGTGGNIESRQESEWRGRRRDRLAWSEGSAFAAHPTLAGAELNIRVARETVPGQRPQIPTSAVWPLTVPPRRRPSRPAGGGLPTFGPPAGSPILDAGSCFSVRLARPPRSTLRRKGSRSLKTRNRRTERLRVPEGLDFKLAVRSVPRAQGECATACRTPTGAMGRGLGSKRSSADVEETAARTSSLGARAWGERQRTAWPTAEADDRPPDLE
jgi:hypothetical protein